MSLSTDQFLDFFRSTSPYIHAHRGKTLVVCLSGEAIDEGSSALIHDLALLRSLGLRLVVVFGARPQIGRALSNVGIEDDFSDNLRVTTAETLHHVIGAAQHLLVRLQAEFSRGLVNSPMHGAAVRTVTGNYVYARPRGILNGVDLQFTGSVRRVAGQDICHQLDNGNVVLIPPYGFSVTGELFNLSALEVARDCARAIRADKLVILGQMAASLPDPTVTSQLTPQALHDTLGCLSPDAPGYQEAQTALLACQQGVPRVHLLPADEPGGLLRELYTRDGCGIMITRDEYDTFRPARSDDIGGILELLKPLEDQGILVRRSRELLEQEVDHFVVNERDGMIIGCAALHPFPTEQGHQAELACVAVHADYQVHGRGAQLLRHIEQKALQSGVAQLFALTTHTTHWFLENGFQAGKISDLPDERQALYNYQRNSRVLIKALKSQK